MNIDRDEHVLKFFTGGGTVLAFLWVVYALTFVQIPEANREIFIHMVGIIEGAFVGGLVSYFFGSSRKEHELTGETK